MPELHPSPHRALWRIIRPDAARWARLAVLVTAASVLALVGPLLIRRIVDRAAGGAAAE